MIPLWKATLLFYTNPMFVALFACLVLREKVTKYDLGGVVLTFVGVVILLNPFQSQNLNDRGVLIDIIGSTCSILAAVTNAVAMIAIRKIGN